MSSDKKKEAIEGKSYLSISSEKVCLSDKEEDLQVTEYVENFKKEVEKKFENSIINKSFKFKKQNDFQQSNDSLQSLEGVMFYDLQSQNVKNELNKNIELRKYSETTNLVEVITKMGRLDSRYLLSQIKKVKSSFFQILQSAVSLKLQSVNKQNEPKFSNRTQKIGEGEIIKKQILNQDILKSNFSSFCKHESQLKSNLNRIKSKYSLEKTLNQKSTSQINHFQSYIIKKPNYSEKFPKSTRRFDRLPHSKKIESIVSVERENRKLSKVRSFNQMRLKERSESPTTNQELQKNKNKKILEISKNLNIKNHNNNKSSSAFDSNRSLSNLTKKYQLNLCSPVLNSIGILQKNNKNGSKELLKNMIKNKIQNKDAKKAFIENIVPFKKSKIVFSHQTSSCKKSGQAETLIKKVDAYFDNQRKF